MDEDGRERVGLVKRPARLALLFVLAVSSVAFACNAPLEASRASRDKVVACEPDTNVQCLCADGTSGIRHCDEDSNLGVCKSRKRACGNGSDEGEGMTPTPAPPLTPPAPKNKPIPEPEADAGDAGSSADGGAPTSTCLAELESNDTEEDADGLSTTRCGALTAADEDFYWVRAAAGETFEVTLSTSGNADIIMYEDTTAKTPVNNTSPTRIIGTATAQTDYIISVLSSTSQTQSYTLRLQRR
jgi:hypothetical protein